MSYCSSEHGEQELYSDLQTANESKVRPIIMHLTASPSFGGTEKQMLELGQELLEDYQSVYVTFREEERCWDFANQAKSRGFQVFVIESDTPFLRSAYKELVELLRSSNAEILLTHGYKPNILGRLAARRVGIPAIAVSHGWTGESLRVKWFDRLDRLHLRWMDEVVCVSDGQARKVKRCGVRPNSVRTICDAVRANLFDKSSIEYRKQLEDMFPERPELIVGSAGRLSPEKGYRYLVESAAIIVKNRPDIGFVLFGDGPLRNDLESRIEKLELDSSFLMPGFTSELDKYYHHFDIFVLPSFTEGLPNVVLESLAARVPVVATAVGGTPEAVEDGVNGILIPPGEVDPLVRGIELLASDTELRRQMGVAGRQRVKSEFSFGIQAQKYRSLLSEYISN